MLAFINMEPFIEKKILAKMTRGYSLKQDLKLLINNPKYSDIEILCGDEKKLYGCRSILAARSEVFDRLLYNGMKESYEKQISFPTINSSGMEIILEYVYTGSINEESLTKDNIIETYYVAEYFQLSGLQDFVIKNVKNTLKNNSTENYSPELLSSKVAEIMPLTEDNALINLFAEEVATIPLNHIEFGRLSIKALQYLLSYTYEKEQHFATSEYEVFRYSAILAAKQVSNDAYKSLMERLPTIEQTENSTHQVENKIITDHQKVVKELEPLIKFIDFNKIKSQLLAVIIEPLEIIPTEIILSVYRHKAISNNSDFNHFRGIKKITPDFVCWDESERGSKLIIEENGKVVSAQDVYDFHQSVKAKMKFESEGIFEWDIIIEKVCSAAWVGICSPEYSNHNNFTVDKSAIWVLGSSGYAYYDSSDESSCHQSFGDDTKITLYLDMNKKTCTYTINGTKYSPGWNNLPSELYPIVGICYPGRIRIQSCQKV